MAAQLAGEQTEQVLLRRRNVIRRPRLTRILDRSTARGRMLVAPAGYGKTTLASEWLEERSHAWYQGGPATMDVAALAVGLADVCSAVVPGAGERMRARLLVSNSPEDDVQPLAELLAEDLMDWPDEVWLAIDDYQYAMAAAASEAFVETPLHDDDDSDADHEPRAPRVGNGAAPPYGEVHELSRATLAMDEDEVSELLSVSAGSTRGLLALADGWPAVIGLAASAQRPLPEEIPGQLFDFFAQELLASLPPAFENELSRLALAPSLAKGIPELLLGHAADEVLRRGEQAGILGRDANGRFAMHPLLRSFLLARPASGVGDVVAIARELVDSYAAIGDWDAAFSTIESTGDLALFQEVLETGLPVLLSTGRLSTLDRWVAYGDEHKVDAAILELARAEVAYRHGEGRGARGVAEHVASRLPPGDPLKGRALLLAGKAALLLHDTEAAVTYMNAAQREHLGPDDAYQAAWGRFLGAARLEADNVGLLLKELTAMSNGLPDRKLRAMSGRWVLSVRMGSIHGLGRTFRVGVTSPQGMRPIQQYVAPSSSRGFICLRFWPATANRLMRWWSSKQRRGGSDCSSRGLTFIWHGRRRIWACANSVRLLL